MASDSKGITERHSRSCATRHGMKRCDCRPTFQAQVRVNGQSHTRTFDSKAAAIDWRRDAEKRVKFGHAVPEDDTLGDALQRFCDDLESGAAMTRSGTAYKPGVAKEYRQLVDRYLVPALRGDLVRIRTRELERQHLVALRSELSSENPKTGEKLNGSTIQNAMMPLRAVVRREMERGVLNVDPFHKLSMPSRTAKTTRRAAERIEAGQLLSVLTDPDRAYLAVACYGGLRAGEISALRWEDVDLQEEKGSIHVLRSFDQKSGETVLPKTDKSMRLVWMPPQLVEILEQYRAATAVEFGAERIAPEKLVFTSSTGGNLRSAVVANRMNKVWAAHGLRRIMLHEARHTYASLAAAAKMPIQVLSNMMGHSSISVTMDLYAHLYAEDMQNAAAQFGEYLAQS
jgi:integrase